jgi:glycosyltransferase involved in cell wall biosynthesis
MKNKIKISYISISDALDIHSWSGTDYSMAKMFVNQNIDVDYIGNLHIPLKIIFKLKQKVYEKLIGKRYDINREPFIVRGFSKEIISKLNPNSNIVFAPSSTPIALLETRRPKVFYTDATFAAMLGFYDDYSNFCAETIKHGNYLEQKALDSSNLAIYSSDWAAKTAIDNYNVDPNKIKVVPFGANIDCNRDLDEIKKIVGQRSTKTLKLLFIGVDWIRKGGDLVVRITKELNDLGLKTELNIAGIRNLPIDNLPDYIINHGYISKRTQEGIDKIGQLFINSHFLVLPSVADCTPIVYSEANSYGVPCITTNVGGIPTIIKDDINGKTFGLNAEVAVWRDYILNSFSDNAKYNALCMSSFGEYQNRLNWNVAGKTILNYLKEL